eukprot:TRINITY_DN10375_c0_g1_i1.p1 TRINITY_DN10375_c0_g1~~TRINITY_DN10375_c0_g1_i1.p1  ORF type:complete len:390 (-),score=58.10 TRINITY_DN10375_c0_g1_i1:14-1135(-)
MSLKLYMVCVILLCCMMGSVYSYAFGTCFSSSYVDNLCVHYSVDHCAFEVGFSYKRQELMAMEPFSLIQLFQLLEVDHTFRTCVDSGVEGTQFCFHLNDIKRGNDSSISFCPSVTAEVGGIIVQERDLICLETPTCTRVFNELGNCTNCSNHGSCNDIGVCHCEDGFWGLNCEHTFIPTDEVNCINDLGNEPICIVAEKNCDLLKLGWNNGSSLEGSSNLYEISNQNISLGKCLDNTAGCRFCTNVEMNTISEGNFTICPFITHECGSITIQTFTLGCLVSDIPEQCVDIVTEVTVDVTVDNAENQEDPSEKETREIIIFSLCLGIAVLSAIVFVVVQRSQRQEPSQNIEPLIENSGSLDIVLTESSENVQLE